MSDYDYLDGIFGDHARAMEIRRRTVVRKWRVKKMLRHETYHEFEVEATEYDVQNMGYELECNDDNQVGDKDGYRDRDWETKMPSKALPEKIPILSC